MAQEIKIPVVADTAKAEQGIENMAGAFDKVAASARRMATGVKTAADRTRELAAAKDYARKALGRDISDSDAGLIVDNFEARSRGGSINARNFRNFGSFEGWAQGSPSMYRTRSERERMTRRQNAALFEGTSLAGSGAPPGEGEGGGGGGGAAAAGVRRIQQQALSFSKSILALAGITSVLAMAAKAKELATEEAVGTDTLKRRIGDLGVSFEGLRDQARSAGQGLGVTYVESQRLTSAYSKEVGNIGATDLRGDGLAHRMRGQYGFARAYGVDPAESTQFFGQMARYGVGRDEAGQRRLAMMIGDSVARSGYGGQIEQLMHSVADYTATAARLSLNTPNVGAYVSAITSMTGKFPGLDTANAASIINAADSSVRRGGAMGDASLNFSYAALRNASPGIRPVDALAVMQGGLFGTTRNTFGSGPMAGWGGKGVKLDDVTNADKMIPLLLKMYGRNTMGLRAVQNQFGLASMANAAAFVGLQDKGMLGGMGSMLTASGIDAAKINPSGLAALGALSAAKNRGQMMQVYQDEHDRKDLTPAQRAALEKAVKDAGPDDIRALRGNLAKVMANIGQEKTPGEETRDSIANLTDLLTTAGGPLMSVLNPIRDAVVALAERIVPGYMDTTGTRPTAPWASGNAPIGKPNPLRAADEKDSINYLMGLGWGKNQAAGMVGGLIAESNLDPMISNRSGHRGLGQWDARRWKSLVAFAAQRGLNPNDRHTQLAFIDWEMTSGNESAVSGTMMGLRTGKDISLEEASAASVAYERPEHYSSVRNNYKDAALWDRRFGEAQRLEGELSIHLHTPDGGKKTVKAPLIGKPKAAGLPSNPFLGGSDSGRPAFSTSAPSAASMIK